MDITYFNWSELKLKSAEDMAAILCLAYGQTKEYDEISAKTIMKTLAINHIPAHLFIRKYFTQYRHSLICNYKTEDKQSYFKNSSFLYYNISARTKVVYLKALSLRRISDNKDYVPLSYFENIQPNMLIQIKDGKIFFPLESSI